MHKELNIVKLAYGFRVSVWLDNKWQTIAGLTNANDLISWLAEHYDATNVADVQEKDALPLYDFVAGEVLDAVDQMKAAANEFCDSTKAAFPDISPVEAICAEVRELTRSANAELNKAKSQPDPPPIVQEETPQPNSKQEAAPKKTNGSAPPEPEPVKDPEPVIEKKKKFTWTEKKIDQASDMWKKGWSYIAIAEAMGTTKGSVSRTANRHPNKFPSRKAVKSKPEPTKPLLPKGQKKLLEHLETVAFKANGPFNIDTFVLATKAGIEPDSAKPFLFALEQKGLISHKLTGNNALITVSNPVAT